MITQETIQSRIDYCEDLINFIIKEHVAKQGPTDYLELAKQYADVGVLKEEIEILNWVLEKTYRYAGPKAQKEINAAK